MISIEQALAAVLARADAVAGDDLMPAESVPLDASLGRILRQEIQADADSPPFNRSIRDGFALRAADVATVPVTLRVIGESRAGLSFAGQVEAATCCEIMTGAEMPAGADAVVMVEDTERVSDMEVRILKSVSAGRSVQAAGTECRAGDRLLASGRKISVGDIGILASVGCAQVRVSRRPRIAIVSTGDELVPVDQIPGPAEIRNSNSFSLAAQVEEAGGEPEMLGIAPDVAGELRRKLSDAFEADIVLTSGGVSMGKYDLVEAVLEELGAHVEFEKVAMKPGKPTVFGWRDRTFVFGLPGNPVSTIVSFQLFVRPLIRRLLHSSDVKNRFMNATLTGAVRCDPAREACVPASVSFTGGRYYLSPVAWKGSSDLVGLSRANAYVRIPQAEGSLEPGASVQFMLVSEVADAGPGENGV
jgi:molybdopterin molybdotransferase